ncbi:tRNA1(Val) A37 N6-methylase TrmN6 [Palleronia marisminoris]|uniref:tRNA1(Val) (Adenine(37)-N6)-methyltransferase n=1 Tax=Palleronia marisminoris TaxID=315423 RepID=A0A1Y5T447_9RHOB|nr:tRNA1(Val) A37 N6-methylase TrmN6 [Palleronia marisminoris]SLN53592.1 tRNA1(Val) (adenine(37)-N6)-methyltransferase [Palleronia marisminoris]
MMSTSDDSTTHDAFLGGQLILGQFRHGYRAGVDPVLLAASVEARPGQSVLDLGCGAGAAMLCLGTRIAELDLHGLEVQPAYAALARVNAGRNGIAATIHEGDVGRMPPALRARRFDRVIANPPYFDRRTGTPSPDTPRETAFGEGVALADWIAAGARRLEPRGVMSVIQKSDRLPDLLAAMHGTLGSLRLRPVQPREGRPAVLVVIEGTKGGRSPARMEAPLILHAGARHTADGDDFSAEARALLRAGAAWE